jgi:hypothetical protein
MEEEISSVMIGIALGVVGREVDIIAVGGVGAQATTVIISINTINK